MYSDFEEIEFTIFDTETTGLNSQSGDRVVELAALRVKGEKRIATFETLVNPSREISAGAFAVNKITPQMLENAPKIELVLPKFLEFILGSYLCSYNAEFDLNFIKNEFKIIRSPSSSLPLALDLLTMARYLLPNLARYPLWAVAEKLEISTPQKHRAFLDVELSWEVFKKLKILAQQKGILDFESFKQLFAYPPILTKN